jgi:transcriptional regulator with XRE-family HTH domain
MIPLKPLHGRVMVRVGGHIKRLREERGWSQPRLAVEAGVAVSAVSQIENGRRSPNVSTLDKLAEAFGVEVADFFPKARSSSLEPSLFNDLEDEQRRGVLAEIRENFRETREGLEIYCDAWEQRIAVGDLDRLVVKGFLEASDPLIPAMFDAVMREIRAISHLFDPAEDRVSEKMLAESSLKPAVDRYFTIGRKLQVMWQERFAEIQPAETQPAKAVRGDGVADFLDYKDAKLMASFNKRVASG